MDVSVDVTTKPKTSNGSATAGETQLQTCADCSFQTTSVRKLGRHRSVNHASQKYKCEHCDFVTGYQSNYYRHRKQVHCGKETTYSCSKCEFSAQSNEGLIVHVSQMHREQLSCPECNIIVNTKSQFQEHMRTYHGHKVPMGLSNPVTSSGLASDNTAALASVYNEAALSALAASINPSLSGLFNNPYSNYAPFGSFGANMGSPDIMSALLPAYMRAQLAMLSASAMAASVGGRQPMPIPIPQPSPNLIGLQEQKVNVEEYKKPENDVTHCPQDTKNVLEQLKQENTEMDENENLGLIVDDPMIDDDVVESVANGETPDPTRKCSLCRYETTDAARFKKHIRCHQTTAETECRQCDFKTVYSWNLDRHVKCHGVMGRYTCLRCSFSQNTRQSMTYHLQNHHNISMQDVQTQTDLLPYDIDFNVTVAKEPYIFEQHAVKYNAEFQPTRDHSPASKSIHIEANVAAKSSSAPPSHLAGIDTSKYLSEHEAIESPVEETDIKDLESDPDIKSRTCSICGYQGKWISEMIRHKRVHTNERPFRCKYCSRTSKWKADLIRHLLKVHAIRVVSKYSRSKTFDSDPNVMRALKEAHGYVEGDANSSSDFEIHAEVLNCEDETLDLSMKKDSDFDAQSSSASEQSTKSYGQSSKSYAGGCQLFGSSRETSPDSELLEGNKLWMCCLCSLHSDQRDYLVAHLESAHGQPPYACAICQFTCLQKQVMSVHVVQEHNLSQDNIVENMRAIDKSNITVPLKRKSNGLGTEALMQHMVGDAKRARLEARGSISTDCSSMGTGDSMSTAASPPGSTSSSTPEPSNSRRESSYSTNTKISCNMCPYIAHANEIATMEKHALCHEPPKGGLFYYKCTYCNWYAKKKHIMYEHLMLHTQSPNDSMQEVEKNLITQPVLEEQQDMPIDLTQKSAVSSSVICANMTSLNQNSILSDFGAILEAAGEEDPTRDNGHDSMNQTSFYQSISDAATSDSEPDIEDEESYLHAGEDALDFTNFGAPEAPPEIQKISVEQEGESRNMWQCRFCPHVSKRRANVRMHEKKHFKQNPVGLLKCPKCNYRGDRRSLNAHYRVHSSIEGVSMPERYPCNRCPANFRSEVDLRRHTQFHNQRLNVTCPKCDYTTNTEREMLLHSQVHRPTVNLTVNVDEDADCDSSSSSSLVSPNESDITLRNGHINVVVKPKKHVCEHCPARFSDRTQLGRHTGFHSSGLSHQCNLCTYAVSFPINLNKHLRSHHGINQAIPNHII